MLRCLVNKNYTCGKIWKTGSGMWDESREQCLTCEIFINSHQTIMEIQRNKVYMWVMTDKDIRRVKENMPMEKKEAFVRYDAVSLKGWKDQETKKIHFIDNDQDIANTPQGLMYLCHVQELPKKETRELWIRPNGSLCIGLSGFIPLKDRTLAITKTTGTTPKDTRYTAKEVK
jgi:hypothetical protein